MFGKKEKNDNDETPQISSEMSENIRTIPPRFYFEEKKKNNTAIFLTLFIALVMASGVGAFLFYKMSKGGGEKILSIVTSTPTPQENANGASVSNTPLAQSEETPLPVAGPAPTVVEILGPEFNIDASDADEDQLTAEEERLFATNANSSDTDSDGFFDANEILAGYDPRLAKMTLKDSGLVEEYTLEKNARILYPKEWFVKTSEFVVIFDSKKGDSVSISFSDNPEKLDPVEWIVKNEFGISKDQISQKDLMNKTLAYKTNDTLKHFVFTSDRSGVYIFTYRPRNISSLPFFTVFKMILESFKE